MTAKQVIVRALTLVRDSRLLWDVMGGIYNRRIYDAIALLYEGVAREVTAAAGAHLIDVGAGRGYVSLLIAARNPGAGVTGIDYSCMQVRAAKKHQRERHIPNCTFEQGNVMRTRFAENTFDGAVSVGSIKHWPDALGGLGEIYRILKPGASVVISETDQGVSDEDLRNFMKRFKVWFVSDRLLFWGLRHVIFGQSITEASLVNALREAGFHNMECLRVSACPYVIVKAKKAGNSLIRHAPDLRTAPCKNA